MSGAAMEAEAGEQVLVPAPEVEANDGYNVKLEIFEGPLDLLLFLIRKKKIEINDIPIAVITRDYLQYLDNKEQINLDREAEFLFIAALLIYIKSQMLLPRETDLAESEDPRRVLVDRLLEYQKVKASCSLLRDREAEQLQLWRRHFIPPFEQKDDLELLEISLFDLSEAFFLIMKRKQAENSRIIKGRDMSVDEKMKQLLTVLREKKKIDFLEYFEAQQSIEEALISFFCILEMVKTQVVTAVQNELFRTIEVWLLEEGPAPEQNE